ncbi:MAG: L,D-transpeptidase family protein [Chitinophagales bacterium]
MLPLPKYHIQFPFFCQLVRNGVIVCLCSLLHSSLFASTDASTILKEKISTIKNSASPSLASEQILAKDLLVKFYENQGFRPAWMPNFRPIPKAKDFTNCILDSEKNGLLPDDYHYRFIGTNMQSMVYANPFPKPETIIDLEILLTDAYLSLAKHYLQGKADPETLGLDWNYPKRNFDLTYYLNQALKDQDICFSLDLLLPIHPEYKQLQRALVRYENKLWAFDPLPAQWNLLLQKGNFDPMVGEIRRRLRVAGDLNANSDLHDSFDAELEQAVRQFQERHGLHADGIVRSNTIVALNRSMGDKLKQIKANLDRWRWLPDDFGNRYIRVNVADYRLQLIDDGQIRYDENVVVGTRKYPTPSFGDQMEFLVLNPFWNIPQSIARNEVIPTLQDDPYYCINSDIKVMQGSKEVDASKINWQAANPEKYMFRQGANAFNPMGQVKFMFPNEHAIYIHDTPSKHLFNHSQRSYSHGCIRIQNPINFAKYLLNNKPEWDDSKMEKVLFSQQETIVKLDRPLPIHILYWTTFVDENGELNFREDIYNWDNKVFEVVNTPLN